MGLPAVISRIAANYQEGSLNNFAEPLPDFSGDRVLTLIGPIGPIGSITRQAKAYRTLKNS